MAWGGIFRSDIRRALRRMNLLAFHEHTLIANYFVYFVLFVFPFLAKLMASSRWTKPANDSTHCCVQSIMEAIDDHQTRMRIDLCFRNAHNLVRRNYSSFFIDSNVVKRVHTKEAKPYTHNTAAAAADTNTERNTDIDDVLMTRKQLRTEKNVQRLWYNMVSFR